jgi:hypothetical protein
MDPIELANRFQYHKPDEVKADKHNATRTSMYYAAQELQRELPEGREKALAMTKLEEAMFWANAAIARN